MYLEIICAQNNPQIWRSQKEKVWKLQFRVSWVRVLKNDLQIRLYCCSVLLGVYKLQGDPMQTVKSNLVLTDIKNVINFNLMMFSVHRRLGIYPWMIIMIISWPLLTSVTSTFTNPLFHISDLLRKYLIE